MRTAVVCCLLGVIGCAHEIKDEAPPPASKPVAASLNESEPGVANSPGGQAQASASVKSAKPSAASSATPIAAEAPDEPARRPATVAEAAKGLDLATFPLMPGAKSSGPRIVASLAYEAPGDVKTAYAFQRRNLLERQWKELSEPQIFDQSASGQFGRDGYHVSVSIFPHGESGKVAIRLQNHGNLNLSKLPVPPGAKLQYAFP